MKDRSPSFAEILNDQELMEMFERVANKNGFSAESVLSNFIKDYIVSDGHPEYVGDHGNDHSAHQ